MDARLRQAPLTARHRDKAHPFTILSEHRQKQGPRATPRTLQTPLCVRRDSHFFTPGGFPSMAVSRPWSHDVVRCPVLEFSLLSQSIQLEQMPAFSDPLLKPVPNVQLLCRFLSNTLSLRHPSLVGECVLFCLPGSVFSCRPAGALLVASAAQPQLMGETFPKGERGYTREGLHPPHPLSCHSHSQEERKKEAGGKKRRRESVLSTTASAHLSVTP